MNKRELFKSLNELCRGLDDKYNINCGGCCYVAAVLAEQFENCNIPFTVIHYDAFGCHYAIRVSDRIINRCDYSFKGIIYDNFMSSDNLYDIYDSECWNETYDTRNNKIVKSKIESLFKKYENRGKNIEVYRKST